MGKLWLPINKFVVKEGSREMTVVIPQSGDKSYDDYLEEAEREKTAEQLKKKPPKPKATMSKEDVAGMLKEFKKHQLYKEQGFRGKYY